MIMTLDNDVLDAIFCECPHFSLASLVLVSSRFHALALPHLFHSVILEKDLAQLASFLESIRGCGVQQDGGNFSKGMHVKKLEITYDALWNNRTWPITDSMTNAELLNCTNYTDKIPVATWAPILTSTLQLMPNLRDFVLGDEIEEIVHHSPLFISTLMACQRLKTISLGKVGTETSKAFGEACSTLPPAFRLEAASFFSGIDAKWIPQPLRVTLQDGLGRFLHHAQIRQHITSLRFDEIDLEGLAPLEKGAPVLFPSLVEVHFIDCDFSLDWLAAAPGIRTLSISFSRIQCSGPFSQTAFPQLVRFAAHGDDIMALVRWNALALETLHILCVICEWETDPEDVEDIEDASNPLTIAKAASNLKSLTFTQEPLEALSWWHAFVEVLAPLTFMDLSLGVESADEARICASITPICTEIPDALAALPLEYVSLSLEGTAKLLDRPEDFGVDIEPAEEGIAILWATRIPSLQYIDVLRERDHSCDARNHYFTIEREDNGVSVRRLDIQTGQKIRETWHKEYAN